MQRIFNTLFAASVSCEKNCYQSFLVTRWERSHILKLDKTTYDSGNLGFFQLISQNISERYEVYQLAHVSKAYDRFTDGPKLTSLNWSKL